MLCIVERLEHVHIDILIKVFVDGLGVCHKRVVVALHLLDVLVETDLPLANGILVIPHDENARINHLLKDVVGKLGIRCYKVCNTSRDTTPMFDQWHKVAEVGKRVGT